MIFFDNIIMMTIIEFLIQILYFRLIILKNTKFLTYTTSTFKQTVYNIKISGKKTFQNFALNQMAQFFELEKNYSQKSSSANDSKFALGLDRFFVVVIFISPFAGNSFETLTTQSVSNMMNAYTHTANTTHPRWMNE